MPPDGPRRCRRPTCGDAMLDTKKHGSVPVGVQGAEPDGFGETERSSSTSTERQEQLAAELAAVRKHLEHRAEANLVISQWRDELRTRLARARLKYELIGLEDEEHAALVAEVHDFKRLCRILGWLGRRP